MKTAQTDFLGVGWGFPPAFSKGGEDVLMVSREEDIMQSLLILLGTSLDERVMRESYGCNLKDYLFEELDSRLLNYLRNAITESIRLHEPRINLEDVNFDIQADYTQSRIDIDIQFLVRSTNSRYNMVYPFYLTEGTQMEQYLASPPRQQNRLSEGSTYVSQPEVQRQSFKTGIHKSTADNTVGNGTRINLPDLDGNSILFVNSVWGDQYGGTTNRELIGVGFTNGAWHIYNLNTAAQMEIGHSFQLLIAPENLPNAFVHTAGMDNLSAGKTYIHHQLANGRPEAHLLVTPRYTETQLHDIAVGYDTEQQLWFIRGIPEVDSESSNPSYNITAGASFNVLVTSGDQLLNMESYRVSATVENKVHTGFFVDLPSLNFNPDAKVFYTQLWRPGFSVAGPLECWYDHPDDRYENWKNGYWFLYHTSPVSPYIPPGLEVCLFVVPES